MIPFASQRGNGQDLATHLLNAHDNERIELFEVRRAVARDLHGAVAEWEAIAKGLTRSRQYLCSLSINPDELQGRLTRAQYLDYIDRAERQLGLSGQPRAIVFHEKRGDDGLLREHCHVVWSRTDVKNRRAIPLSFFKEKLMTVTREFARDHGLRLPPGYDWQEDEPRRDRQLSAYDGVKQKETGISHEERMAAVTDAWRRSDSAKAFVAALGDLGYVLARGRNQTRVVLVDFYGHTTALTRLIDDASVRAKHVRDFLGAQFGPDKLPSVEQAQEQAAQRRAALEAFEAAARDTDEAEQLARQQAARREDVEAQAAILRRQQHDERVQLAAFHKGERQRLKTSYLAAQRRIRIERARRRPDGLAAFLARMTGIALVIRKLQRYRDRKRYAAYVAWCEELRRQQRAAQQELAARHDLQTADIQRRLRALDRIEQRERDSAQQAARRERRQRINARHAHMPSIAPVLNSRRQEPAPPEATSGSDAAIARVLSEAAQLLKEARPPLRLTDAFAKASSDDESGEGTGDSSAMQPVRKRQQKKRVRRRALLRRDFRRAASGDQDEGDSEGSDSNASSPAVDPTPSRPRRRKGPRSHKDHVTDGGRSKEDQKQNQKEARKDERQRRRRRRRDPGPGI
ncbi:MAG: relaxase [Dehalococcoidia bacterium]